MVREFLGEHDINTIDADSIGHEVLMPGGPAVEAVSERWPETVSGGVVDRKKLGSTVFADEKELRYLESITHPAIFAEILSRVASLDSLVVVEIPLLVQPFDPPWKRIVVDAPDPVRRQRTIDRGSDPDDVDRRMAAQPSRQEWLAQADLVIPNHGTLAELEDAVSLALPTIRKG